MKSLRTRLLPSMAAVVGLGFTVASHATIVTWEAAGVLTEIDRSGGLISEFASADVGTSFTVRYTFDTSSLLNRTLAGENGGLLYDWHSAIISSELEIGGELLNRASAGSLVRLRDNFAGSLNYTLPATMVVDGISLSQNVVSTAADGGASYDIIFRGPEDLSLYSGSTLPEDPSPILPLLALNLFQFTDTGNCGSAPDGVGCLTSAFAGHVNTLTRISVPEPNTIVLLAIGLLGIGVGVLRRNRSTAVAA